MRELLCELRDCLADYIVERERREGSSLNYGRRLVARVEAIVGPTQVPGYRRA